VNLRIRDPAEMVFVSWFLEELLLACDRETRRAEMVKKRLKKLHAKDAFVEMHHCFLDLLV
jgi:hypothetical protein